MLLGFGSSFVAVIGAGLLFGIGFGIFDANNMPILCQFVSAKHRGTAYGIMNMTGCLPVLPSPNYWVSGPMAAVLVKGLRC